ncbi:hypothetical protein [Flavobacterium psychrophilum]|nr:hypothetical protein [Flavobacterium psychrophilum]
MEDLKEKIRKLEAEIEEKQQGINELKKEIEPFTQKEVDEIIDNLF